MIIRHNTKIIEHDAMIIGHNTKIIEHDPMIIGRNTKSLRNRKSMANSPKLESDMLCPIEFGLEMFGGRWKSRIICVLSAQDTIRYSAIRKELSNITDAVLASMLKELTRDGLVSREQFEEMPPRVEYSLTEKGKSVLPVLQSICAWARDSSEEDLNKKLPSCQSCPQLG